MNYDISIYWNHIRLFVKNKVAVYVFFSELIIVVKKCIVLTGLGLAEKIPPTGLGKNAGPLSFSYNETLTWANSGPLVPALYSCLISSQRFDQPSQGPEFIHSFNKYLFFIIMCSILLWELGYSTDQTSTILAFIKLCILSWNQPPWLSPVFCFLCPHHCPHEKRSAKYIAQLLNLKGSVAL